MCDPETRRALNRIVLLLCVVVALMPILIGGVVGWDRRRQAVVDQMRSEHRAALEAGERRQRETELRDIWRRQGAGFRP
jgi:hypothetical protein